VSYIEQNLMPGEQVVYRAKMHWVVFLWTAFWLAVGLLVALGGKSSPVGPFVIGAILGIMAFLNFSSSEFAVTNKRVIIKVGIIRCQSLELLLNKIEGVSVNQGILGRMLGYGTITVNGTGSTREPFKRISEPLGFRRAVHEQIEAVAQRPAASASAGPSRLWGW
jgi:uncharacterized membrane protein YdbT with pleckstrin-like domain